MAALKVAASTITVRVEVEVRPALSVTTYSMVSVVVVEDNVGDECVVEEGADGRVPLWWKKFEAMTDQR